MAEPKVEFIPQADGSILCVVDGFIECVIDAPPQHDQHVADAYEAMADWWDEHYE